jgi:tetratricopeptide (TPR) repeat protein
MPRARHCAKFREHENMPDTTSLPSARLPDPGVNYAVARASIPAPIDIALLRRAAAWQPASTRHWRRLGTACARAGRHGDAAEAFTHASRLDPDDPYARIGLIHALVDTGRCLDALAACHEALEALPADPAHPAHPARPALRHAQERALLHANLAEHATDTQHAQDTCIESGAGHADICDDTDDADDASLPSPCFKVGLVWTDYSAHSGAPPRSLPLSAFAALAGIPGAVFFALQTGPAAQERTQPPHAMDWVDLCDTRAAPADMAGTLAGMDLLICPNGDFADTAARLGLPVWILVPSGVPDTSEQEDFPCHPGIKVFRQTRRGDWTTVMERVAATLAGAIRESNAAVPDPVRDALLHTSIALAEYRYGTAEDGCRRALAAAVTVTPELIRGLHAFVDKTRRHQLLDALEARIDGVSARDRFWFDDLRALMLAEKGEHELAWGMWERLLARGAPAPAAWMHYGAALHAGKQWKRAADMWKRALALHPDAPLLNQMAADAFKESGDAATAAACLRRAAETSPQLHDVRAKLGVMLREQGSIAEASTHLQAALLIDPEQPWVWDQMGYLLKQFEKKYTAAKLCFLRSLALKRTPYALMQLGICHYELGEYEEALPCFDRYLLFKPGEKDILRRRADCLYYLARLEESLPAYVQTAACNGFDDDARRQLLRRIPNIALSIRNLDEGYRLAKLHWDKRVLAKPEWNGEPLEGKTILVYQSNGYGDSLQYVRLLHRLKPARVIYAVWPGLVRLFKTAQGIDELHNLFDLSLDQIDYDYQINDYGLSGMLATHPDRYDTREPGVQSVPYLATDPALVEQWRERLADDTGFKIGIAWSGNSQHGLNRFRSSTLADWLPLADIPGVSLYNMQRNEACADIYRHPHMQVRDFSGAWTDFADAAAMLSQLDLVISIDSAPAHLAGAIGKPVWLLLAWRGIDWRWPLNGDRTPWYPATRIFRQRPEQSWHDVLAAVKEELAKTMAAGLRLT